jgi:hypothetical protein
MRGDRESRAQAATRHPRAERGVIDQDFVFRGILTANKLSEIRENEISRDHAAPKSAGVAHQFAHGPLGHHAPHR